MHTAKAEQHERVVKGPKADGKVDEGVSLGATALAKRAAADGGSSLVAAAAALAKASGKDERREEPTRADRSKPGMAGDKSMKPAHHPHRDSKHP